MFFDDKPNESVEERRLRERREQARRYGDRLVDGYDDDDNPVTFDLRTF